MWPGTAAVDPNERNEGHFGTMWVIVLEALVALCLLILIVWLTMTPSRKRDDAHAQRAEDDADSDEKS